MAGTRSHERKNHASIRQKGRSARTPCLNTKRATTCGLNFFRESLAARCQFGSTWTTAMISMQLFSGRSIRNPLNGWGTH